MCSISTLEHVTSFARIIDWRKKRGVKEPMLGFHKGQLQSVAYKHEPVSICAFCHQFFELYEHRGMGLMLISSSNIHPDAAKGHAQRADGEVAEPFTVARERREYKKLQDH